MAILTQTHVDQVTDEAEAFMSDYGIYPNSLLCSPIAFTNLGSPTEFMGLEVYVVPHLMVGSYKVGLL